MPRQFRAPSDQELPAGPWGDFVREVGKLYRQAGRPTFRAIEDQIVKSESSGYMSRERLRRMVSGTLPIPRPWADVEAAILVLAQMAQVGLADNIEAYSTTRRRHLLDLWNQAMDSNPSAPDDRSAGHETEHSFALPPSQGYLERLRPSLINDDLQTFVNDLRLLQEAAGQPSLSWLARRANVTKASLIRLLKADKFPHWELVEAFVQACNAEPEDWRERWEQLRVSRQWQDL